MIKSNEKKKNAESGTAFITILAEFQAKTVLLLEEYISRSYNMNQAPYIVQDKILIRQIRSKAMRYIRLLEQKKLRDQNNILSIRCKLKK